MFLVRALSTLAVFLWIGLWALFMQYDFTRPTARQSEVGRIYPSFNHGHTVYLTLGEQEGLRTMDRTVGVLFVTALSLGFSLKWYERRRARNI